MTHENKNVNPNTIQDVLLLNTSKNLIEYSKVLPEMGKSAYVMAKSGLFFFDHTNRQLQKIQCSSEKYAQLVTIFGNNEDTERHATAKEQAKISQLTEHHVPKQKFPLEEAVNDLINSMNNPVELHPEKKINVDAARDLVDQLNRALSLFHKGVRGDQSTPEQYFALRCKQIISKAEMTPALMVDSSLGHQLKGKLMLQMHQNLDHTKKSFIAKDSLIKECFQTVKQEAVRLDPEQDKELTQLSSPARTPLNN